MSTISAKKAKLLHPGDVLANREGSGIADVVKIERRPGEVVATVDFHRGDDTLDTIVYGEEEPVRVL